jgi:hypothetical protein
MEAGRQGEGTRFRAPFDALVVILTVVFTAILVAVAASAAIAISGHAGGALVAGLVVVGCAAIDINIDPNHWSTAGFARAGRLNGRTPSVAPSGWGTYWAPLAERLRAIVD